MNEKNFRRSATPHVIFTKIRNGGNSVTRYQRAYDKAALSSGGNRRQKSTRNAVRRKKTGRESPPLLARNYFLPVSGIKGGRDRKEEKVESRREGVKQKGSAGGGGECSLFPAAALLSDGGTGDADRLGSRGNDRGGFNRLRRELGTAQG